MPSRPSNSTSLLLLLTGLIISLVLNFYLLSRSSSDQSGPPKPPKGGDDGPAGYGIRAIDDQQATNDVIAFRNLTSNDSAPISFGVYYTPAEIKQYLDSVYPKLVAGEIQYFKEQSKDWSGYEWRVGCYWMLRKDRDGIAKTDFCFVPTLVNKKNKYDALDYFVTDSAFYSHQVSVPSGEQQLRKLDTSKPKGPVYNTGTMFP